MANDAVEILKIIKNVAKYECGRISVGLELGTVDSITDDDLVVETADGNKIYGMNLILSDRCKPRFIKIPYEDDNTHIHDDSEELDTVSFTFTPCTYGGSLTISGCGALGTPNSDSISLKHKHKIKPALQTIKLWRGLQVDDLVLMLRMSDCKYLLLERISFDNDDGVTPIAYNPKEDGDKDNPDKESES